LLKLTILLSWHACCKRFRERVVLKRGRRKVSQASSQTALGMKVKPLSLLLLLLLLSASAMSFYHVLLGYE
jgi:hypothetical protein